jgi:UDP-galactopyranose mutase
MNSDIVIFANARELDGKSAAEIHRLPLIKSLSHHTTGKILVVTHYVSLLTDIFRSPLRVVRYLFHRPLRKIGKNSYIYTPVILFNLVMGQRMQLINMMIRWQIKRQLQSLFKNNQFNDTSPKYMWLSHPYHIVYNGVIEGKNIVVYDCYDYFSLFGFKEKNTHIEALEKKLASSVDMVLACGSAMTERLKHENPHTYNFPTAIDRERFLNNLNCDHSIAEEMLTIPSPRIGFCGCLKSCDNIELLEQIICMRPDWSFVFIAEVAKNVAQSVERIKKLPNVHFLGWRNLETLPRYLKAFDVGLMISRVNELTDTFVPYKLFEYFGAGIPVVSTPIREVLRFQGIVEIADTAQEFVAAIERCFKSDKRAITVKMRQLAETENWDERANLAVSLFKERQQCVYC